MTDSKEIIERLASWPASLGKGDALSSGFVASLMGQAGVHIAALEARVEADAQTIATLRADLAKAVEGLDVIKTAITNHEDGEFYPGEPNAVLAFIQGTAVGHIEIVKELKP